MKIGILGASGQVGFQLALKLNKQRKGDTIVPCVRNSLAYSALAPYFHEVCFASGGDNGTAWENFDVLINCTAVDQATNVDIQNNLAITKDTYNHFQGNLYIQFSSIAVYGDIYDKTRSSFESPKPNTLYGYSKRAIEEYCRENSR